MTPQEAIAQGLPKPSECDIVIVILWSRLGTPLPEDWRKPDGSRYRSGTEWEYEDAVQAAPQGKPKVLLYRRTEKVLLDPDEAEIEEKVRQWQEVKAFFAALRQPDGSLRGGCNDYATPAEFKDALNLHLRVLIQPLLSEEQAAESNAAPGGGVTTSTIDTGGGAYIGGNVNIQKGDFVGRDKVVTAGAGGVAVGGDIVNRDKYEEHHHYHDSEGPAKAKQAEAAYRQDLASHCDTLPLRGVDPTPGEGTTGRKPLSLAQVYIALDTQRRAPAAVIAQALQRAAQGQLLGLPELSSPVTAGRDEDTRPLSALEATLVHRNWVLLGKPGAGKTTFVNYLTHALAVRAWEHLPGWPEQERDALPIRVILRDFARWLANQQPLPSACPELLWGFIAHDLKRRRLDSVTKVVEQALDQPGRAVVFLDGLDEVPPDDERLLALVRDSVTAFTERYHHSRHLVTCRVLSYQEPRWQLSADLFPPLELAPFNDGQIDRFIDAWYTEVGAKWRLLPGDADRLADKLRQAVRRPGLWQLAPNPLLLTVMALVHTHRKELPEKRALLYHDAVDILLQHWEQHRDVEATPPLRDLLAKADRDFNDLKDILERLAFTTLD